MDAFFECLAHHNEAFQQRLEQATASHQVLRYVAMFDGQMAQAGLRSFDDTHPFYRLQGSNNMIILTTDRYNENPLIIEGPGAGADVTAAGVLADIIALTGVV